MVGILSIFAVGVERGGIRSTRTYAGEGRCNG